MWSASATAGAPQVRQNIPSEHIRESKVHIIVPVIERSEFQVITLCSHLYPLDSVMCFEGMVVTAHLLIGLTRSSNPI